MNTLLLLGFVLGASATQPPRTAAAEAMPQLNEQFRSAYKSARQRAQDGMDSVILCYSGDKLVWLRGGKRHEASYLPELYHDLKTLAHLPLALYALLEREPAGPLDSDTRGAVEHLLVQAQQASRTWGTRGFTPEQLNRQQRILQLTSGFANDALRCGHFVRAEDMRVFTQGLRGLVYENTREAARLHVNGLHKQVQAWRKEMGEAGWHDTRAVVITSHMAARHEVSVQYFEQAFGQTDESDRLAFAQYPCDDAQALELLATHVLDGAVGERFFDNPMRMHRDILSDAVTDYLNEISVSAAP